jgi:hypothetical protein
MRIEIPSHSYREDIHCINGDIMTLLSDQEVFPGDEIVCPNKRTETHYAVFHVEEIVEKRRPMGDWHSERPNLYKIRFRREMVVLEKETEGVIL